MIISFLECDSRSASDASQMDGPELLALPHASKTKLTYVSCLSDTHLLQELPMSILESQHLRNHLRHSIVMSITTADTPTTSTLKQNSVEIRESLRR